MSDEQSVAIELPQDDRGRMPNPPINLYDHLPFQIGMLSNLILRVTSDVYVRESGLSAREWRVLGMLGCKGAMMPAQVATETGMDRATITRAVAKLEKLNYVFSGEDQADGRRKVLYLTEKGAALCDEIRPLMEQRGEQFRDALTKTERKYYYQIMKKLQNKALELLEENE